MLHINLFVIKIFIEFPSVHNNDAIKVNYIMRLKLIENKNTGMLHTEMYIA